ncbi:MAG: Gfo/Idh/MocA family oxidoreductase [Ruminococcaceae bacterium]|nr:Gfo/Idh/MocA family oxidoreductase [Oscillospiraceae bacterium]
MKRIGIIGAGGIANGTHIKQLLEVPECRITAICDIDPAALKKTGDRLGLDEAHRFTDYRALVDCADVDAVEICVPNYLHVEMAKYAVSKGKPINVEKPLGMDAAECEGLQQMLEETGVTNMMCFSYRFRPAVRYAKWIIDQGLIGNIVGVNVAYLKSSAFWEGRRLDWRFVKKYAGTGVLGDLGVHLIDMATLLVGDIQAVSAVADTVVKRRQRLDSDEWADVETDDYSNFLADIIDRRSGERVSANFSITRCAIGHANTIRYDIFGDQGVISFDLNNPNVLGVCSGTVDLQSGIVHTVNVPAKYSITQEQAFVDALHGKFCDYYPTVAEGVQCQRVLDALIKSNETRAFVNV